MELTGDSAELVECGSNCAVVVLELGTIHGGQQQMLGLGKIASLGGQHPRGPAGSVRTGLPPRAMKNVARV